MKRRDFFKLAGIGLIGAVISPKLFAKDESNILDDVSLREMLSKGEVVKYQNIELHRTLDLKEYPTAIIHNNIFTKIGKSTAINMPYNFKGNFFNNVIITKRQFLF